MSDDLRIALHELVHARNSNELREAYRRIEADPLTAAEREICATLFNSLIHHQQLSKHP
jgi:hypothetical protein